MKGHDGVLNYYYDKENYDSLEPAQRCGLEIWYDNGKHFKIWCAVWNTLSDIADDLMEIIGEPASDYMYMINGWRIDCNTKLDSFREPGRFGCIQITAIKTSLTREQANKDVQYLDCYFEYDKAFFTAKLMGCKSIEDHEGLIRYHLPLKALKYYKFYDYKGNRISFRGCIDNIPALGLTRIIKIKRGLTFPEAAKKLKELTEKMPKGNESDNE